MAYHVLLVEDEARMREIATDYFTAKGCGMDTARDGLEAMEKLALGNYDLVLLDIMLPGLDGFSICREIRKSSALPVIFLTARGDEDDKLYGYGLGADDYVTKPFSMPVLYAKAMSLIRRAKGLVASERTVVGEVEIDHGSRRVFVSGALAALPPIEYGMLCYLAENRGRALTREQLLIRFWGYDFDGSDRVVDSHIKKLRKALGSCAGYIRTVVKVGYKLEVPESEKK